MTEPRDPTTSPASESPPSLAPVPGAETWVTRVPGVTAPPGSPSDGEPTLTPPGAPAPDVAGQRRPAIIPGYEVLEELGRGGMGVVYKARQVGLKRLVALKMILAGSHASRAAVDRFRTEAEALARLHHPNIVHIYEIDECEGRPYFSMEYASGGSLADFLRNQRPEPADSAAVVETLARAIQAAHLAGIIHRDLKPANILLVRSGLVSGEWSDAPTTHHAPLTTHQPKITDFGLAKRLEDQQGQTRSGDVLGTPSYMAPEQATGQLGSVGPATDVYALGAILYEMLTGRPPFGRATLLETLDQVRTEDPTPPRSVATSVPRDLEIICLKCLRKEPRRRYASAAELADDLGRFLTGEPIRARPVTLLEKAIKTVRRHPVAVGAVLGVLLLLPVGLLIARAIQQPTPAAQQPPREFTDNEIHQAAAQPRRELFQLIRRARTPEGWVRADLSRQENLDVESWSQAQALCIALNTPDAPLEELRELAGNLELLFTQSERITRGDKHYGWRPHVDTSHTQAEPALWAAAALAVALGRPGLVEGEQRARFEKYLAETHTILKTYEPYDGDSGWNILPNFEDRKLQNTYTNTLALLALLETRRAGLGWAGSEERRDALLRQTAGWLVRHFDEASQLPGWHKDNRLSDRTQDGLTLNVYAVLLRADTEADVRLPASIHRHIRPHLLSCARRTLDYPDSSAYTSYPFLDHDGRKLPGKQNLTFLWYPWAVECCQRWLEHARLRGSSTEEVAEVRRVLGHLIVELGPESATKGLSFIFIPAERLLAFNSIPLPAR